MLLERKQLTCGTTWHAAGLVGQLRATRNLTELAKYTTGLFEGLEAETGQATGFKQNGSISVALERRAVRGAEARRLDGQELRPRGRGDRGRRDQGARCRIYELDGAVGGVFLPKDGQVNPIDVTQALAAGARQRGARIFENTKVTRILVEQGQGGGRRDRAGHDRAPTRW